MKKTLPGRMERNNIRACQGHRAASCMSGASCSFVQGMGTEYAKIKAVVQVYHCLFCLSEVEREGLDYGS